jgi:hypothetical protein
VLGKSCLKERIPDYKDPPISRLCQAKIDKPISKKCSTVSDVPYLDVTLPLPLVPVQPGDRAVGFNLPVSSQDLASLPNTVSKKDIPNSSHPPIFDDKGLVVPPVISVSDVTMKDATITNPHPIASVQEYSLPISPIKLGQSNAEILADMMSSERGDCSDFPYLFLDDTIPVVPVVKPAREKRATNLLFPKPVPVIAGQIRGPPRVAKAPATLFSEDLKHQQRSKHT